MSEKDCGRHFRAIATYAMTLNVVKSQKCEVCGVKCVMTNEK